MRLTRSLTTATVLVCHVLSQPAFGQDERLCGYWKMPAWKPGLCGIVLHFGQDTQTIRFYNPEGQQEFEMLKLSVQGRTARFRADEIDFRVTLKSNNRAVLDGQAGEVMLHGPLVTVRYIPAVSQPGCSWPKRKTRDPEAARVELISLSE